MPDDENMSIILGRPFLNTAGAVIDCNKGKVTFNVNDKEHTIYFPKNIDKRYGLKILRPSRLENSIVPFQCHKKNMKLS